jgi:hypothetical protein
MSEVDILNTTEVVVKKKRGRKKKSEIEALNKAAENEPPAEPPVPKKRGRKPKGGKLIIKPIEPTNDISQVSNIILHLKCSLHDIDTDPTSYLLKDPLSYNPVVPPSIMTYNNDENYTNYNDNTIKKNNNNLDLAYNADQLKNTNFVCNKCQNNIDSDDIQAEDLQLSLKDINYKLKEIKLQLYKDSNPDKKSACFWCTYEFDNPPCYIPKYEMDGNMAGYGSFCRPECAVAYLMKENIDDSAKYERYQLLNRIYGKVYNYEKNIRPAPNPYYLLDKFYGNLTIQEYRKLLKSEHMLLIIEKPLTRILPELHEDTDDNEKYSSKLSSNKSAGYKVKRASEKQKGPSKNEIMKEKFGF